MIKKIHYQLVFVSGVIALVGTLLSAALSAPYVISNSPLLLPINQSLQPIQVLSLMLVVIIFQLLNQYLKQETISLPSSVKGFIISLPDETHELDTLTRQ